MAVTTVPEPAARLLPPPARAALDYLLASVPDGDSGEVGIVGAIVLVVGFAIAAGILVTAVDGKLSSWISQIP